MAKSLGVPPATVFIFAAPAGAAGAPATMLLTISVLDTEDTAAQTIEAARAALVDLEAASALLGVPIVSQVEAPNSKLMDMEKLESMVFEQQLEVGSGDGATDGLGRHGALHFTMTPLVGMLLAAGFLLIGVSQVRRGSPASLQAEGDERFDWLPRGRPGTWWYSMQTGSVARRFSAVE